MAFVQCGYLPLEVSHLASGTKGGYRRYGLAETEAVLAVSYRQTDPESTKKVYRTSRGVLSYLAQKMVHGTVKFGRLPLHRPNKSHTLGSAKFK